MKPLRLAVDTNVLLDFADGVDTVLDALTLVLHPFDLVPPVISSPREIVRKFFH